MFEMILVYLGNARLLSIEQQKRFFIFCQVRGLTLFIYCNTICQIDIIYSILATFFHLGALDYFLNGLMIEPLLGEGLEDDGTEELDVVQGQNRKLDVEEIERWEQVRQEQHAKGHDLELKLK